MMCWRGNHFTADKEKAAQWMSHDMDEDVPVIPLYTAPPSTAEVKALDRIIEAFDCMANESDNSELHQAIIDAKRLREEA